MADEESEKVLDGDLRVRVSKGDLAAFAEKSLRTTGKPYQLLMREIMVAFNEDRLRIIPTTEQQTGVLYNVN